MPTHSISNQPLAKSLRTQLENTVKAAREVAEKGARAALGQLAVGEAKAPDYLTDEFKALRRRLRAHGRALGDAKASNDTQDLQHLVWEVAYEHWHRMLFARFLAENGLLLWEPGAAVSLDDCEALVQEADPVMNLGAKTKWELAGKLAARMLPQVFKPHSPVFELAFAPEHQRELERLLAGLPSEVFQASDSLGWVYQFWQAKRKDEVNASEVKIGADELPAVTQLFTEPYMVDFLLHNSLGAWWVTRHPGKACPVPLTYLRTLEDGSPAAGKFEGWPNSLQGFKLLDPCCGSGHFLVAAFLMLVPMRMAAEGLTAMDAVDFVLQDNLHGLELDARCVEIAVFALALAAWRFPDESGDPLGVRADMPAPQVACCGLKVAAKAEDWMALVPDDAPNAAYLRQELGLLHASFAQAPLLGSLLDPARSLKNDLATASFDTLRELLERALTSETPASQRGTGSESSDDTWDLALTARGLLEAARLLERQYHLVVTNVPYRKRADHCDALRDFIDEVYPDSRADLANVFVDRCVELTHDRGALFAVTPQNWLFLASYKTQRKRLLMDLTWPLLAKLGPGAFQEIGGHVVKAALVSFIKSRPSPNGSIALLDVASQKTADQKAAALRVEAPACPRQAVILASPDYRVQANPQEASALLEQFAAPYQGLTSGDNPRFVRAFWECDNTGKRWSLIQSASMQGVFDSGRESALLWDGGLGALANSSAARIQGTAAWTKRGITVSQMAPVRVSPYFGGPFDMSCTLLLPREERFVPALWAYCSSSEFNADLAELDQKMNVTTATVGKVPFDVDEWSIAAKASGITGLPSPQTNSPTQWLFHGHPQPATDPLQVAVARLAGYRWPAETDESMELADEARTWIARCEALTEHIDDDGIVCLPSVRGEPAAHDRLLKLLIAAWETVQPGSWKPAVLDKLLADADCAGKGLDVWLRDKFFEQHTKRFQHRPFIWHVWDGLKDGFAALVNYHKLDAKNLERLIHTYLGDWIRQQEAGVRDRIDGAQTRLAAAQDLKRRLEHILEGELPYDIFVRWKPLVEQPIGWKPDLNDGVRLNIRPFMTAEVLRHNKKPKLNISWDKDRGKDVESAPWFHKFEGDRINDHHLKLDEKRIAKGGC
ncbi:Eco57I restriction-modification methylase domain-containing protein [Laribacter hongkongensis]|uniref:Eco57I restriction-modification methylase domain-containing protein n=1 Tax=Laribacter hongkongensis TaxID=168471 RepID=UPI001EFC8EFD|nr:DNA methyltransferase [Laribacter hongkongensis]MCG9093544.1 BREX-1 system adenine-specific DNA-methyltransferase PglX [Laribacter hongkongensis]